MATSGGLKDRFDQYIHVYWLYHAFRSQEVAFATRMWQVMPNRIQALYVTKQHVAHIVNGRKLQHLWQEVPDLDACVIFAGVGLIPRDE